MQLRQLRRRKALFRDRLFWPVVVLIIATVLGIEIAAWVAL